MGLLELPVDLHEIIIEELLAGSPAPLFAPIYKQDNDNTGDDGDLVNKCAENYVKRDQAQLDSAQALMNWSSTCHHFRKLLSPKLFKSVILRSRPKSVASIKTLRETWHWNQIESFLFVGTEDEFDEEGNIVKGEFGNDDENEIPFTNVYEDGMAKYSLEIEMSELNSILSDLPPNLRSLTLDFPNGWRYEWGMAIMEDSVFHGNEDAEEEGLRYRCQLQTAISAVTSYNLNAKSEFELKLLSIPVVYCEAYDSDPWHQFLGNVTSFTLAFCHWDNGAGWNMNVYGSRESAGEISARLSDFFLDHLESVRELHIYADDSWPLGAAPAEMHEIEVRFPQSFDRMPVLEHVRFKQFFICETLQDFLLRQIHNLKSVDFTDCFASGADPEEEPNWRSFFSKLADSQPKKLTRLIINNASRSLVNLFGGDRDYFPKDDNDPIMIARRKAQNIVATQETESVDLSGSARQRQILAHVNVDDKYGMIFDSEELNVSVFLDDKVHEQWLRLVDLMEENTRHTIDDSTTREQGSHIRNLTALRSRH